MNNNDNYIKILNKSKKYGDDRKRKKYLLKNIYDRYLEKESSKVLLQLCKNLEIKDFEIAFEKIDNCSDIDISVLKKYASKYLEKGDIFQFVNIFIFFYPIINKSDYLNFMRQHEDIYRIRYIEDALVICKYICDENILEKLIMEKLKMLIKFEELINAKIFIESLEFKTNDINNMSELITIKINENSHIKNSIFREFQSLIQQMREYMYELNESSISGKLSSKLLYLVQDISVRSINMILDKLLHYLSSKIPLKEGKNEPYASFKCYENENDLLNKSLKRIRPDINGVCWLRYKYPDFYNLYLKQLKSSNIDTNIKNAYKIVDIKHTKIPNQNVVWEQCSLQEFKKGEYFHIHNLRMNFKDFTGNYTFGIDEIDNNAPIKFETLRHKIEIDGDVFNINIISLLDEIREFINLTFEYEPYL
jgi:hypothetical protein